MDLVDETHLKNKKFPMTTRMYLALIDAYFETASAVKSAQIVGMPVKYAKYYIDRGSAKYPPIRKHCENIRKQAVKSYDVSKSKELRFIAAAGDRMLGQFGAVLNRIQLAPEGDVVVDAEGRMVVDANGDPYIKVTASTFRTMASTLRMLADLKHTNGERQSGVGSPENATTVTATPVAAVSIAEKIGHNVDINALARSDGAGGVLEALAHEESLRRGNKDR